MSTLLLEEEAGSVLKERAGPGFFYDFCSACSKSIIRDCLFIKSV